MALYPANRHIDNKSTRIETAYLIVNKLVKECILKPEEANDYAEELIQNCLSAKQMTEQATLLIKTNKDSKSCEKINKQKVIEDYGIDLQKLSEYNVDELYQAVLELNSLVN